MSLESVSVVAEDYKFKNKTYISGAVELETSELTKRPHLCFRPVSPGYINVYGVL